MKSGTSTLAFQLGQHPDIFMADRELHFFDNDHYYSKGIQCYEQEFKNWQHEKMIGEKTPAYCLKEIYAKRIALHLPGVKMLWIFRNPIERTYSEYWHVVRKGGEKRSFEDSIFDNNQNLLEPEKCRYLERSIYFRQVQTFLKYFPRKNMYFTTFEKFTSNPQQTIREIFDFLDVDANFNIDPSVKKNVAVIPKNHKIQNILDKMARIGKKYVNSNGIISQFYRKIAKLNQKNINGYPKMDLKTREKLSEYFAGKNQKLISLTGLDILDWNLK